MRKRIAALVMLIILCMITAAPALAAPPSKSYTYSADGFALPSPAPYRYMTEIDGSNYPGVGTFNNPQDLYIDKENYIYILDSGNSRVVIFDEDRNHVKTIDNIRYKNEKVTLHNKAQGIFVYEYNDLKYLYIADTDHGRIIRIDILDILNSDKDSGLPVEADEIYTDPNIKILDQKITYQPAKLIVDRAQRMFVICTSINRGVVKLTANGEFDTFFGAPSVTYTAVEKFWRMISTKEQLSRMKKFVPTEYSNITLDSRGFVYLTCSALNREKLYNTFWTDADDVGGRSAYAPVKKLAADGTDILSRTGIFPPVGDVAVLHNLIGGTVQDASVDQLSGVSAFKDVCINEYDVYSVLDNRRCKVFTYDSEGNLLFIFSNVGTQDGTVSSPTAIAYCKDEQIAVLDSYMDSSNLVIFEPTDYGKAILNAVKYYRNGEYEQSEQEWIKILKMNSNMTQAYSGVGKSLLRAGQYKEAMRNFKISKNTEYYSKALEEYLMEIIGNKFTYIFLVVVGSFILYGIYKLIKRFRRFLREGVQKVV